MARKDQEDQEPAIYLARRNGFILQPTRTPSSKQVQTETDGATWSPTLGPGMAPNDNDYGNRCVSTCLHTEIRSCYPNNNVKALNVDYRYWLKWSIQFSA